MMFRLVQNVFLKLTYQEADYDRRRLDESAVFLQCVMFLHLAADQVGAIRSKEDHDEERHHQRPVDSFERRVKVDRVVRHFVLVVAHSALGRAPAITRALLAQPSLQTTVMNKSHVALNYPF